MRRTLNLKLFLTLSSALVVMAVGVHFLHAYQVRRSAGGLLDQATKAEQAERYGDATKFLNCYLGYVPEDTDALARYGFALDKLSRAPAVRLKTLLVFDQVLRLRPGRTDVRRRLVSLSMGLERYQEALEHLGILLEGSPDDAELEELVGRCHEAAKNLLEAEEAYQKSKQLDPGRIDAYTALALMYRRMERAKDAANVLDELVKKNPKSFQARVRRALYLLEIGSRESLEGAEADLAYARDELKAADEAEVLLASAEVARARHHTDDARRFLEKGLKLHPRVVPFYLSLGQLELQSGKRPEAITCLRRGLEQCPSSGDLLWSLTDLLTQTPDGLNEATEKIELLRQSGSSGPMVNFLEARLLVANEQWYQASEILEKLHGELATLPDLAARADLLLGECYEQMGDADQQYAVCRRALAQNPLSVPASRGMAAALLALGKVDESLEIYKGLVKKRFPGALMAVARLRIQRSLVRPVQQRQAELKDIDDLLAEKVKSEPDEVGWTLLRGQSFAAQGRYDDALKVMNEALEPLRNAPEKQTDELSLRTALVALKEQQGDLKEIPRLLAEAERRLGDRVELRLARASYWVAKGGAEGLRGLKQLAKDADGLTPSDQLKMWRGLTTAYSQMGNTPEAVEACKHILKQRPHSLNGWLLFFDLNLHAGDEKGMSQALEGIEKIEGPHGALGSYGKIVLLTWRGEKGDKSSLEEARPLMVGLAARRPGWARAAQAEARLDELSGRPEQAIAAYQRAVELGERSPAVIRRLLELLLPRGRFIEADQAIRKLPEQSLRSSDLQRLAAESSLRSQEMDKAVMLARTAVAPDSRDHRGYIWLGQILEAAGRPSEEVEKAFRQAVELSKTAPDAWVALVQHLVRAKKTKEAEDAIRMAQTKIPTDLAPLAMAQCQELMGRMEKAKVQYLAALDAKPTDPAVLRAAATFFFRTKRLEDAEKHLTNLIRIQDKGSDDAVWATHLLALVLISTGDHQRSAEALKLLDRLSQDSPARAPYGETAADVRLKAIVLAAQRDRQSRLQAVRLLENLAGRQPLDPEDQFLLAQLHDGVGEWRKARPALLALVAIHPDPRYLSHCVSALLRHDDLDGARAWLAQLEKLNPDAPTTIELKARLLRASGQAAQAVALLKAYAASKDARIELAARLLEEFGQDVAEEMYRKLAADTKTPEHALTLAAYLGRRRKTEDAMGVWEQARDKCPLDKASLTAVAILHASNAHGEPCRRVTQWLEAEIQKHPEATVLLERQAFVYNFEGRYRDAEILYRKTVDRDRSNVTCLNNLAWLILWNGGDKAESLARINQAITLAGPDPSLLDTRGVVYLALGQNSLGLNDLQEAAADKPTAQVLFHLARAHLALQNRGQALTELTRAEKAGLQAASLHPLEHDTYQRVLAALKTQ